MAERKTIFTLREIERILPHRPPFLFVDRVVRFAANRFITTERLLLEDEPHFVGHFPGKPIMPGVLVVDALAQTSGLLWGFTRREEGGGGEDPEIFLLASARIKFLNPATPGQTLEMTAHADKNYGILYTYTVEASVGRTPVAKGSLTLAMTEEKL